MKSKIVAIVLSLLCISTLTGCNLGKLATLLPEMESAESIIESISEEIENETNEIESETEESENETVETENETEEASAEAEELTSNEDTETEDGDEAAKTLLDTAVNNLTSYSYDCEMKIVMDMGSELLGDMGTDLSGLFGDVSTAIEIVQRTESTVDAENGTYVAQGTTTTTAFGTVTEQETIVYTVANEDGYTSYNAVPNTDIWLKEDVTDNPEITNFYENVTELEIIEETDTTYVISGTMLYENVSGNIDALTTDSTLSDNTQINALYIIDKETEQLSAIEITYSPSDEETESIGFEMTISLEITGTDYVEVIIPEDVINSATESNER